MAGTELGKAWVQIVPSADGISGSISKLIDPEASAAGASAGSKLASGIKRVIGGAAIGAAFKNALSLGADLQQNLGGTEAVFGEFANEIQTKAQSAYKNMGMSASEYMATANKMASLFHGSGVEGAKAVELTETAMQRAADVASVMGIDVGWAMDSIANAAKGNFTMMDNLGVKMNATAIEAYALEKGINFKWNTATEAEKAELAMQMFFERSENAAGNFARESEHTLSGSIGAMKAAYKDFMGNLTIGEDIGPAMNNLVSTAVTAAGNIIPAIGNVLSGLPGAVSTAINQLHPALMSGLKTAADAVKTSFPQMLSGALDSLLNFSATLRSNAGQLVDAGLTLVKNIADGIIQNIPKIVETVPTIISNFAGIINDNAPKILSTGLSIIANLAKGIIQAIPVIVANLPKIIQAIWDVFTAVNWLALGKTVVTAIGNGIKSFGQQLPTTLKGIAKKALDAFKNIQWGSVGKQALNLIVKGIQALQSLPGTALRKAGSLAMKAFTSISWGTLGRNVVQGIVRGVTAAASLLINALKGLASRALEAAKSALGINSPSKVFRDQIGKGIGEGMALGIEQSEGMVSRAMKGLAGSLRAPDVEFGSADYSARLARVRSAVGSGGLSALGTTNNASTTNNFNINVSGADDPAWWADELTRRLKMNMRVANG